jgi:hypothetical protein
MLTYADVYLINLARGVISPTESVNCIMTGTIVAVKGMLSTNAEKIADAHIISAIEKYLFFKRNMPGKSPCTRKDRRLLTYADVC